MFFMWNWIFEHPHQAMNPKFYFVVPVALCVGVIVCGLVPFGTFLGFNALAWNLLQLFVHVLGDPPPVCTLGHRRYASISSRSFSQTWHSPLLEQ
jgi:hypothetical protein